MNEKNNENKKLEHQEQKLEKELNLADLIFVGIGSIVGAGVLVILGRTIVFGGRHVLIGFFTIAIISIIMGFVYIEIYSRYKSGITEYLAVKDTIGEKVGKLTLYVIYLFAVFTSMTIIICMTKYIGLFKKNYFKEVLFSIGILIVMTVINLAGIKTSKFVSNTIGISMLVIFAVISIIGFKKINLEKIWKGPNVSWNSFVLSTILALFLFNGYDVIIKMSPEAKKEEDTKKAVVGALGITTTFYILLILILISVLGYQTISKTDLPLSKVYTVLTNPAISKIVYLIGIIILFNTAFLTLIGASRFLYGLAKDKHIPFSEHLTQLNSNHAPKNTIILSFVLCVICALFNNEVVLAVMTNFSVIYILIVISIALLILRWREKYDLEKQKEHNYIKGNLKNIPTLVVVSLIILVYLMIVIMKNKFWINNNEIMKNHI